jgi:hypothetical protein
MASVCPLRLIEGPVMSHLHRVAALNSQLSGSIATKGQNRLSIELRRVRDIGRGIFMLAFIVALVFVYVIH